MSAPEPAARRGSIDAAADRMAAAYAAAENGDYARALEIWAPLAHAGVARAQSNVGACFANGLGVAPDGTLALRWLTLAAEAGDAVGQRNLATLFFKGELVELDAAAAARWYRAASAQGDAESQDMLSWLLVEAELLPPDYEEARRWALAAAQQGVASSMTRLGMLHHNALGVARDPAAAAEWWRKAAPLGDADAQAMLGAAHHMGAGVARDPVTALSWLLRAERAGSKLAAPFLPAESRRAVVDLHRHAPNVRRPTERRVEVHGTRRLQPPGVECASNADRRPPLVYRKDQRSEAGVWTDLRRRAQAVRFLGVLGSRYRLGRHQALRHRQDPPRP